MIPGGALIPGTAELAAEILGLEARVGRPLGLDGGLEKKEVTMVDRRLDVFDEKELERRLLELEEEEEEF